MKQYEIKITGRVQGVWFRKYTEDKANELGIKGWVRNTADGNVLAMALGERKELDTFIDFLKIGPPMSRVDKISTSEITALGDFENFTIKY